MPDNQHAVTIKAKVIQHTGGSGSFATLDIQMGSAVHWAVDSSTADEEGRSPRLTIFLDNMLVIKEIMAVGNAIIQDQPTEKDTQYRNNLA
jgi:hypothetical protein|tara:strand:+ start:106 stop:378 length:273 start_codon:yes stop_codon:yes gene_type:complete